MDLCLQADEAAKAKVRSGLRILIPVVILASGLFGVLGVGWVGLAFPTLIVGTMPFPYLRTNSGQLDKLDFNRGVEHVQILAVNLHRWYSTDPKAAQTWLNEHNHLGKLAELVSELYVLGAE